MAEGAAELDPRLERARCGHAADVQALFEASAEERADVVFDDALRCAFPIDQAHRQETTARRPS